MILKPQRGILLNRGHRFARGLVGFWLMNEGGGNIVYDLSGNGGTGTVIGAEWIADYLQFTKANSDYILSANTWQPGNISTTMIIKWMPTSSFPGYSGLISGGTFGDGWSLYWYNESTIRFHYKTTINLDFTYTPVVNQWVELALVLDAVNDTATLYADGKFVAGRDNSNYFISNYPLTIGARYNGTPNNALNGNVNRALIYNRALTASEIAYLYHEPFCMFGEDM